MKDTIIVALILLIVAAVAGLAGYKLITKGSGENNTLPGGDQRTFIYIERYRINPNPITLSSSQTNLLVISNISSERHEIVKNEDDRIFGADFDGLGRNLALIDNYFLVLVAARSNRLSVRIGLAGEHDKDSSADDGQEYSEND